LKALSGYVKDLSHDGRGIIKIDKEVYFVEGALVGELVNFSYQKRFKKQNIGRLLSVVEVSSKRVTPRCEYFEDCGGCAMQHLDSEEQVLFKQNTLVQSLSRLGNVEPTTLLQPIVGQFWNYRRRIRLATQWRKKTNSLRFGFRQHKAAGIVPINHCHVMDSRASQLLPELQRILNGLANKKNINQLEITCAEYTSTLLLEHSAPFSDGDIDLLASWLADNPDFKIYLKSGGVCIEVATNSMPYRLPSYLIPEFGIAVEYNPTDFIQINGTINKLMIKQAVDLLEVSSDDSIVDFFCGIGNFSLPFSTIAKRVLGLELNQRMVDQAERNAQSNKLHNVKHVVADLYDSYPHDAGLLKSYNKVLLDPPRSGAGYVISELIPKFYPEKILYVSCNPATLARDSGVLVNKLGYRLESAGIIDMFPHTAHVESTALFTRS
jgi:23S rRNA (uracil1939-C5)-methyltransferase